VRPLGLQAERHGEGHGGGGGRSGRRRRRRRLKEGGGDFIDTWVVSLVAGPGHVEERMEEPADDTGAAAGQAAIPAAETSDTLDGED
jgi:hypothetical protein